IQSGPRLPCRARLKASVLAEPSTSCATWRMPAAVALGSSSIQKTLSLHMFFSENRFPPRIGSGAGFFRNMRLEQRLRRLIGRLDQRPGIDEEQEIEQPGHSEHRAQ